MAHPLRLKILCALKGDELPVLEWAKNCLYINNQFQNFCIFYSA
jgi:hypothetical protein